MIVELPVTFGLGRAERVDRLRVIWPDGSEQELVPEAIDAMCEEFLRISEERQSIS